MVPCDSLSSFPPPHTRAIPITLYLTFRFPRTNPPNQGIALHIMYGVSCPPLKVHCYTSQYIQDTSASYPGAAESARQVNNVPTLQKVQKEKKRKAACCILLANEPLFLA